MAAVCPARSRPRCGAAAVVGRPGRLRRVGAALRRARVLPRPRAPMPVPPPARSARWVRRPTDAGGRPGPGRGRAAAAPGRARRRSVRPRARPARVGSGAPAGSRLAVTSSRAGRRSPPSSAGISARMSPSGIGPHGRTPSSQCGNSGSTTVDTSSAGGSVRGTGDHGVEVVDLVQIVPAHGSVVVGERAAGCRSRWRTA